MNPFFLLTLVLAGLLSTPLQAGMAEKAIRQKISGLDVIAYPTEVEEVVTFRGTLPAGDSFAPADNLAVATLVGEMLDKGTTKEDKFVIAGKLESVGAIINFSVDGVMLSFSGKCLRKDLPMVIPLLAEELRMPLFSEEELGKLKKQIAGNLQRSLESTSFQARSAFAASLYPVGHPNYEPPIPEFLAALEKAKMADLRAFHQAHYGPDQATLVLVGDIDLPQMQKAVQDAFADWKGGQSVPAFPKVPAATAARDTAVFMPDKTNITVLLGQVTGLKYNDPDTLALRAATAILGSGFTGRLMANVRDKEGLTYGIGSGVAGDTFSDGDWRISANFAPALLEKGLASTKVQLDKWYGEGVTAEELTRTKTNLVGTFKVGLATTDGLAAALINAINRGYDVSWLDEYPQRISALSLEQVNGVIKKYLQPEKMTLIKAGTIPKAASGEK